MDTFFSKHISSQLFNTPTSSKACKTSFYFFGAVERRLEKKHLEVFPVFCPIWNFSDIFQLFIKSVLDVFLFYFEKACIIFKKKTLLASLLETFRTCNIFLFFTKSVFFMKIMQAFLKKKKKKLLAALLKTFRTFRTLFFRFTCLTRFW